MKRRKFLNSLGGASGLLMASPLCADELQAQIKSEVSSVLPGIWKFTIGTPEKITPQNTRSIGPAQDGLMKLPVVEACPVEPDGTVSERGVQVRIPLKTDEYIYGLGLQLQSFQQRGLKKMLRVNADPVVDSGDSHAPVPFFVTTSGYGILVDTARYATFYLGNKKHKPQSLLKEVVDREGNDGWNALNGPYERLGLGIDSEILIEIPRVKGVDVRFYGGWRVELHPEHGVPYIREITEAESYLVLKLPEKKQEIITNQVPKAGISQQLLFEF